MALGGFTMSVEAIAAYLAEANDFVQVSAAICHLMSTKLGVIGCSVSLHLPSGQPVLAVDNLRESEDHEQLGWLLEGWKHDAGFGALRMIPSEVREDARAVALPLIHPGGLLGQVRCTHRETVTPWLRRDMSTLSTSASVRLTQLGVTATPAVFKKLTLRQRDVARLAAKGLTNAEIAKSLGCSDNTVKKHLKDAFGLLGVSNRTGLAGVVGRAGPIHDYPVGVSRHGEVRVVCAAL